MELADRYCVNQERNNVGSNAPSTTKYNGHQSQQLKDQILEEEYDFVAHRHVEKPTNLLETTGHLIKGTIGGGLLGIHESFMKCGLWTSIAATILFGCFLTYCVHILVKSAQVLCKRLKIPQMSYPDLAEKSIEVAPFPSLKKFSKIFRYMVDVIVCIDQFGTCCVYQIIIAKTLQGLVEGGNKDGSISMLRLYLLALLVPVLLLCMITSLKYLAPFTFIANVFIALCVTATIVYAINVPDKKEMTAWKNFDGFFEFCGVVVFSMNGVAVSLPIENTMAKPKQFPVVISLAMFVSTTFLVMVGFFGYWGFGDTLRTPVMENFPKGGLSTALKGLIAFMIFITFALCFWGGFVLVWHYLKMRHPKENHYIWERVYRALLVIAITVIAIIFPNMGNMMGLIGSFCLFNNGFIFPAVIETLVVWEHPGLGPGKWRLWKNIFIFSIGFILFLSGTYTNGKALLGF